MGGGLTVDGGVQRQDNFGDLLGGDAVWAHNSQPVHYRELWMDDRADMLRFPGVVACSEFADVNRRLCELAKEWSQVRYED